MTDRRALAPDARTLSQEVAALERWLDEALEADLDLIQIRERDLPAALQVAIVRRAMTRGGGLAVVVNDRADVAVAAEASGVHLPANAPPARRVRDLGPGHWLIGRSVHAAGEAATAHDDLDYLLFGTVFESASKPAGHPVAGLEELARTASAADVPVLAIGGIVTPERVRACRDAGAAGVAGIGTFLPPGRAPGAIGVAEAARVWRAAWVLQ